MRKMELYKLTFPNGKAYIGISTRSAKSRFVSHLLAFNTGKNKSILYSAWRKHGQPEMRVLAEFTSVDELRAAERAAIADFGTLKPNGYNMTYGGDSNPMEVPEIAKRVGLINRGKKASEETRKLLSSMRAGRELSEYHCARISEGQRGRIQSEETRKKIRAKAIGRKASEATIKKMSKARMGHKSYPRTDEVREKMAKARADYWAMMRIENPQALVTAAAKQGEALKANWAKRLKVLEC